MRIFAIVGAAVLLAIAGLWFLLRSQGDEFIAAQLEREINRLGGTYESIEYDLVANELLILGLSVPDLGMDGTEETLDLFEASRVFVRGLGRNDIATLMGQNSETTIADRIVLEDVVLVEEGQRIAIGQVTATNWRVVPVEDALFSIERETRDQDTAYQALRYAVDEITISEFASPREGVTGAEIASVVLSGYEAGTFERLDASALQLWDNGQIGTVGDSIQLQFADVTVSGVDMSWPLIRTLNGDTVDFDRQNDVPIFASAEVNGVVAEDDEGTAVHLTTARIENAGYVGGMATETIMAVSSLQFPLDAESVDAPQANTLRRLGYDEIVLDFDYHSRFDMYSGAANLEVFRIAVQDMGEINLSAQMQDIPFTPEMAEMTSAALIESGFVEQLLAEAKLSASVLGFSDLGLVDRLIQFQALQQDQDPSEVRADILDQLSQSREELAASPQALEALDAIASFVTDPGTISITAQPAEPVPVSQVLVATQINPALLLEILNLRVTAED